VTARPGRFERAEGGTLFLDDVDDVPLAMQVKLLRALQNRTVERLGGTRPIPIDVRVVAGTKRDLRQLVAEGRFREDLYYRLNVLAVNLPPLRERLEDLPLLVDFFLQRFFARKGEPAAPLSPGVLQALMSYRWPGNVRELENTCERMAESCTCGHLRIGCLGASVLFPADEHVSHGAGRAVATGDERVHPANEAASRGRPAPAAGERPGIEGLGGLSLDEHLRKIERDLIAEALAASGGNKSRAAGLLRIKRSTLGDRIVRCGLPETEPSAAAV
jgi:DNA-binding NtrC family response regulator